MKIYYPKNKKAFLYVLLMVMFFVSPTLLTARDISLVDCGILSAKNGTERYEILYKAHKEAISKGVTVDYSGLSRINLVIPNKAKSIPLADCTDFKGVEFYVTNNEKDIYLFTLTNKSEKILLNKSVIAKNKYITELAGKNALLSVTDNNPWVKQRRGYNYGMKRMDLIVVKNGKLMNNPIGTYNNDYSSPECIVYPISNSKKQIRRIKLVRSPKSSNKTFFLKIEGLYNVQLSNISIITPNSNLNGDYAIKITNCANVLVKNVTIDGTYSQKNKFGYGISLNNVYNVTFQDLTAHGEWGIFGNNNTNKITLTNCDINRFDVHCYGKDITCKNCTFRNLYNQYSSLYGTLRYENCRFINFVPVLFESSYSAYTYFRLEIEKCIIDVDSNRPYLINAGNPSILADEPRPELSLVYWPDISIKDLTVSFPERIKYWTLFHVNSKDGVHISGELNVAAERLKLKSNAVNPFVRLSNKKVHLQNKLKSEITNSNISTIEIY